LRWRLATAYVQDRIRPIEAKLIADIVAEFVKSKTGKSERHHQTLKNDTARFAAAFRKRELNSITASEIELWLKALPGESRTKRTFSAASRICSTARSGRTISRGTSNPRPITWIARPTVNGDTSL